MNATTAKIAKKDPRVRRTHRILRDALVSLILQKDYASISIKEITDRADVAYITFFRHYNSMDELLMEVLEDGLAELITHIETLAVKSEDPALVTEESERGAHSQVSGQEYLIDLPEFLPFPAAFQKSNTRKRRGESHRDLFACAHRMVAGKQDESTSCPNGKDL
jgi:AcrR family transcriptional regulator